MKQKRVLSEQGGIAFLIGVPTMVCPINQLVIERDRKSQVRLMPTEAPLDKLGLMIQGIAILGLCKIVEGIGHGLQIVLRITCLLMHT